MDALIAADVEAEGDDLAAEHKRRRAIRQQTIRKGIDSNRQIQLLKLLGEATKEQARKRRGPDDWIPQARAQARALVAAQSG